MRQYAFKIGRRNLFFKKWNLGAKENVQKKKGICIFIIIYLACQVQYKLVRIINFMNIKPEYYEKLPFKPCIDMLHVLCPDFLAKKNRLCVNIPVTIVFKKRQVYWLYNDRNGLISNKDLVDDWQSDAFKAIVGHYYNPDKEDIRPVAVLKTPDWNNPQSNTTRILRERDLDEMLREGSERLCIQAFIPSRGNASLTRLVYHPGNPITGWSICNKKNNPFKNQNVLILNINSIMI